MYTYQNNSLYSTSSTIEGVYVWVTIAVILAIIGGVLGYFLFTKAKTEPKGKFLKWLKDFLTFKTMWIEDIMGILYHVLTIFVILFSFSYLSLGGVGILYFLIMLVLGPLFVRLGYELIMMLIMIWRNTSEIAKNSSKKTTEHKK